MYPNPLEKFGAAALLQFDEAILVRACVCSCSHLQAGRQGADHKDSREADSRKRTNKAVESQRERGNQRFDGIARF